MMARLTKKIIGELVCACERGSTFFMEQSQFPRGDPHRVHHAICKKDGVALYPCDCLGESTSGKVIDRRIDIAIEALKNNANKRLKGNSDD